MPVSAETCWQHWCTIPPRHPGSARHGHAHPDPTPPTCQAGLCHHAGVGQLRQDSLRHHAGRLGSIRLHAGRDTAVALQHGGRLLATMPSAATHSGLPLRHAGREGVGICGFKTGPPEEPASQTLGAVKTIKRTRGAGAAGGGDRQAQPQKTPSINHQQSAWHAANPQPAACSVPSGCQQRGGGPGGSSSRRTLPFIFPCSAMALLHW